MFNDDIQSTAAAAMAALYGAIQIAGVPSLQNQKFVLLGAGQASIGIANLLVQALQEAGASMVFARACRLAQLRLSSKACSLIRRHERKRCTLATLATGLQGVDRLCSCECRRPSKL